MIEKDRLEELIEQGATVYSNDYGEIALTTDNDLSLYENGQNGYILYALEPNKKYHYEIFDEDLFETQEEAEWHKEFGNITRTERLELPTWENVIDIIYGGSFGVQTIKKFDKCKFGYKLQLNGNVYIFIDKGTETLFMGSLTKENYTLACRKAKELFLGEEDG